MDVIKSFFSNWSEPPPNPTVNQPRIDSDKFSNNQSDCVAIEEYRSPDQIAHIKTVRHLVNHPTNTDGATFYGHAKRLLENNNASKEELDLGLDCLRHAYRQKHVEAIKYFGLIHQPENALGKKCGVIQSDWCKAVHLEIAHHLGDKTAAHELALLYLSKKNLRLAKEWELQSRERTNDIAAIDASMTTTTTTTTTTAITNPTPSKTYNEDYQEHLFVVMDSLLSYDERKKRIDALAAIAESDHVNAVDAAYALGNLYFDGRQEVAVSEGKPIKSHRFEGQKWLKLASEKEHSQADMDLALAYQKYFQGLIHNGPALAHKRIEYAWSHFRHLHAKLHLDSIVERERGDPSLLNASKEVTSADDVFALILAAEWTHYLSTNPKEDDVLDMLVTESSPPHVPVQLKWLQVNLPKETKIHLREGDQLFNCNDPSRALISTDVALLEGQRLKRLGSAHYKEAVSYFKFAAEHNHPQAVFELGKMHAHGLGTEQNYDEAIGCFKLAAANGFHQAYCELGKLRVLGHGREVDDQNGDYYKDAMNYFDLAITLGVYETLVEQGKMYLYGHGGVRQDYAMALEKFELAQKHGVPESATYLGIMYGERLGVRKDVHKATEYFKQADAGRDPYGIFKYTVYREDLSRNKKNKRLNELIKDDQIPPHIRIKVHSQFLSPNETPINKLTQADFTHSIETAQLGSVSALKILGFFYSSGIGVEKNKIFGNHCARRFLELRNCTELHKHVKANIAPAYAEELRKYYSIVPKDLSKARINCYFNEYGVDYSPHHCFWRARFEKENDGRAGYNVAMLYLEHRGVAKNEANFQEGVNYLRQAAESGNQEAIDTLQNFELIFERPLPEEQLEISPVVS